jgi:hypothetical protein
MDRQCNMKAKHANFINILVENFNRKVSLYGRTFHVWVNSKLDLYLLYLFSVHVVTILFISPTHAHQLKHSHYLHSNHNVKSM